MQQLRAARPSIGVGGLVFDQTGRVLLICRRSPPQAGAWHIPGGRLEPGETLYACCRREVREETGIEIIPGPIVAVADRMIEGFHYLIIDFLAELAPDSPREPLSASDASDALWVHPHEFSHYPLVQGLDAVVQAGLRVRENCHYTGLATGSGHAWLYLASPTGQEKLPETET